MLTEEQARELATKVVNAAKTTAHVDTGALKRSISFTYVKNEIIFRQLFYGSFGDNSSLEKIAKNTIPNGVAWKIILTSLNGETIEISRTKSGRAKRETTVKYDAKQTTENIKKLIESVRKAEAKRLAAEAEQNE